MANERSLSILFVSQYYPPETAAPAVRVSELAQHWVSAGHDVQVLTGFPNHPTGIVPHEYRPRLRRLIYRESLSGAQVTRSWLVPLPNRKSWERALNYCSFCLSAAFMGSFLRRPDLVIGTTPQLLVPLAALWVSRRKGVPFVLEVRDLWPESLVGVGATTENSAMYRMLSRIATYLYRRADHIVVVTPAFKECLVQNWRIPEERISVIPNGVETEAFVPDVDRDAVRHELGIENKFVLSYIGTMGNAAGLDTLLDAADRLRAVLPEVVIMMVGAGAERERLAILAAERGLTNLRFLDAQPREKVPALIAASDACLVLLKKSGVFETVIPTKLLEFMACARPVILGVQGQAKELLENAQAGIAIEPENSNELVEAVVALARSPERRKECGMNGRRVVVERFSRRGTAEEYAKLLARIIGEQEAARTGPEATDLAGSEHACD